MPTEPENWNLEQLLAADLGRAALLATPAVADRTDPLPFDHVGGIDRLQPGIDTLIVVGGGTLIDEAKAWRVDRSPATRLVAIPSLWGSGAEVSPVAVLDHDGSKEIRIGAEYVPDVRCRWPELAASLPDRLAKYACGDAWAHALEGFLSPLADSALQGELANLLLEMLALPLANDSRWFEASARACAGQARSSVGLVHGIAHTLEGPLRIEFPGAGWGHAKLCSVFGWPVMAFNRVNSDKWQRIMGAHGLDEAAILGRLRDLHEPGAYEQALGSLDRLWMQILRDPCSRSNCTVVKPAARSFFLDRGFQ